MAKVTGIGGVFFKAASDNTELAQWYKTHLGLTLESFGGAIFNWQDDKANDGGLTVWHVAPSQSEWFHPSKATFMINYRVDDLNEMLEQLKSDGVTIVGELEHHENGKFAWILDPDGNKIELWEPMLWDDKNK